MNGREAPRRDASSKLCRTELPERTVRKDKIGSGTSGQVVGGELLRTFEPVDSLPASSAVKALVHDTEVSYDRGHREPQVFRT